MKAIVLVLWLLHNGDVGYEISRAKECPTQAEAEALADEKLKEHSARRALALCTPFDSTVPKGKEA